MVPRGGYVAPELPARYVRRTELEERIESGLDTGLVVVSAPAGSGKTLLLASWATHRKAPTAWLTLEPVDGEPHLFWGRVLTAIQASCDLPADSMLAAMLPPPAEDQRFVRLLAEGCEELPTKGVVVLDDLHLLTGTPAMRSLASAIGSGLWGLPVVLSTRSDPVIPLQRLRLEGRVCEIRSADINFELEDAGRLLAAHGVKVLPEHLSALLDKTEGWAAGLRLAALSLEGSVDTAATIRELAGEQRTVADYFMQEVLAHQDRATTQFLLDTCIVNQVSADLAEALTGRQDSGEMLARLERDNLFVLALDSRREWYRYHQLFGDLLRHRLRAIDQARSDALHQKAAEWFAAQGDILGAASHLSAASDWVGLARFVLRRGVAEIPGSQRSVLANIMKDLPEVVAFGHPEGAAAAATVAAFARHDSQLASAHMRRSRELLGDLTPADAQVTGAVLVALEAILAWVDADAAREVTAGQEAERLLSELNPAEVPALPVYQASVATIRAMGLLWSGQFRQAERAFATLLHLLTTVDVPMPVIELNLRGKLAVVKGYEGQLREARVEIETALAVAESSGWSFLPLVAGTHLADAQVHLLEADLEGCAEALNRGAACIGDLSNRHLETALALVETRMLTDRSEPAAARKRLELLRQSLGEWRMPRFLEQWSDVIEAEIALTEGDVEGVLSLLSEAAEAGGVERPYARRLVVMARAHLLANRPRDCLECLQILLEAPPEDQAPAVEARLVAALAHDRLREDAQAQRELSDSLAVAAPEGIVRPYVVAGQRVSGLLSTYLRTTDDHAPFVRHVLGKLGTSDSQDLVAPLAEPLTVREQGVLLFLPTMMTNGEIADELHVSVNTVKVHLKGINRKLGVASRRQAVARARALGLLRGSTSLPASS